METFREIIASIGDLFELIFKHGAFLTVMLVLMVVTQIEKNLIFTRQAVLAHKGKSRKVWYWLRKTLPLHPVVVGIILGIFWRNPEPGYEQMESSMGLFALAGICSVFVFDVVKRLAKYAGWDIKMLEEIDEKDSIRPESTPAPAESTKPPIFSAKPSPTTVDTVPAPPPVEEELKIEEMTDATLDDRPTAPPPRGTFK